ncbi:MAG TPA: ABC transporter permease [Acidimicrobiia bacterium]|nr:ABC transporter permease [Acidimicrobiia bacterium]
MTNLWLVTRRELRERGRSKGFIISSVLTVAILLGIILIPQALGGDAATFEIGAVGEGNEQIVEAARQFEAGLAADEETEPDIFEVTEFSTAQEGEDFLRRGDIEVLLIDGSSAVIAQQGFGGNELVERLQRAAGASRLQALMAENEQVASEVVEVLSNDPLEVRSLSGPGSDNAESSVIAYAGLVLLYIAILTYGNTVLTGVTEEKNNRVVEVLLATLQPWQMLGGKVLGIGILGLAQFALTMAAAFAAIRITGAVSLPAFDLETVGVLVLWFLIGFAIYAALYAAAGSLTSRTEDAQSAALPMTMLAVVGFFVSFSVLDDPASLVARITTFIPFTAAFVVPIRNSLGAISWAEHALAVVVAVGAIVLLVLLAARIYAGGLLRFGGRVRIKEAWRTGD